MHPNDLEELAGRALKRLPSPRAPRTLLARVMQAVEREQARPWHERPWLAWPLGWQLASAFVAIAVLGGASLGIGIAMQSFSPTMLPGAAVTTTWLGTAIDYGTTMARGLGAIWRSIVAPLALVALLPVLMMFTATVLFGAALSRLAFGGPSET